MATFHSGGEVCHVCSLSLKAHKVQESANKSNKLLHHVRGFKKTPVFSAHAFATFRAGSKELFASVLTGNVRRRRSFWGVLLAGSK